MSSGRCSTPASSCSFSDPPIIDDKSGHGPIASNLVFLETAMFTHPAFENEQSRRQWITGLAQSCLGVSLLPAGLTAALEAAEKAAAKSSTAGAGQKAKQVIYLFMNGAMSQIDTFDPKPASSMQGETKAIQTKIAGVQFGEFL